MDEERFNMDTRMFLKTFGVTAQREIENAVREGIRSGELAGDETLAVRAVLTIEGLLEQHTVTGEIALE
ncbi:MAG TPA: DUF6494 family protein [Longimicrobiales bacterium]|nr:DUF6494 family protein [Longimicrobiales bacterium]